MRDMNRGVNDNMMIFPPIPELDSIKYYKQALQVSIHHFYIVDEIGEVGPFLDMINVLKTAEQHDTIFIYLNTPGGNLYTAIQIISAIRQSSATVVTSIEGMVASAGTLIFLSGQKHIVNQNCTFMIHNYSHGVWGKGNEVNLRVKHMEDYFKKLAKDMYSKFLTDEEIDEVVNGKDFWMESEEVLRRLGAENSAKTVGDMMQALSGEPSQGDAELIKALIETVASGGVEIEVADEDEEEEVLPPKSRKSKAKKPKIAEDEKPAKPAKKPAKKATKKNA